MKLGKNWGYLFLILIIFIIPVFIKSEYYLHILILSVINIILTSSVRAIAVTGQVSMGHAGFKCIGAYTSAIIAMKLGLSPYLSIFLGGLAALVVAGIIAYPITRVKTVYFSMLTMFFGIVVTLVTSEWRSLTGGTTGIMDIPSFGATKVLGIGIDFNSKLPNLYFVLILMVIVLFFLYGLDRSYIGMTLKAISQDESLAASIGINVARSKAIIFCIGCFIAGVAGCLMAYWTRYVSAESFTFNTSILYVGMIIIGGLGTTLGPIFGAIFIRVLEVLITKNISPALQDAFPQLPSGFTAGIAPFLFGLAIVLFLIFEPRGLAHRWQLIKSSYRLWPFSY